MEILRLPRLTFELGVKRRKIGLQEAVGLLQGRDRSQPQLLDQPVLECGESPLDPALGLWRVGLNELDPSSWAARSNWVEAFSPLRSSSSEGWRTVL